MDGNRKKSKRLFNYGLVGMVYAELKLEHKVDWNTYPTTTQYPLYIGKTEKDILDMYIPEFTATKRILGFLKKKLQGASSQGSSSKQEATLKATQVCETNNLIVQKPEPMVQNLPPSGAIQIVVQGFTVIVESPS
jgi:hypothetical protein